jgi:hypothetical protein
MDEHPSFKIIFNLLMDEFSYVQMHPSMLAQ